MCMRRCSNPALGSAILSRRKDFVQTPTVKQFIGIFGENVLQVSTSYHLAVIRTNGV